MTNNNVSFDDLLVEVKKYIKDEESLKKLEKAYNYASAMHEGQFRKTGEKYIVHPISVALILTTILADVDTLCAALLHDVIEDTDATKEDLKRDFGEVVANLVDGVTKINNINVSTENEYLTSYYKKIIVGMSEDVRVIIIKLADRLHNMRTLYALPIEKQKKKAKETLEILAPIAHRLGMHKIKSELEDLSLKYLKRDVYYNIVETLNNTKLEREECIREMMDEVSKLLNQNNIKHEIKGRAKSIYSIYRKLDKGRSWNDIYDLLAIRILVEKESECYLALGIIHSKFKPISKRFKDYIAMPKTNLYQTLHTTVFGLNGNLFEIQIRTYDMDEIAENGIASHWAYKENKDAAVEMQNVTEQKLQFYKSIIELNEEKMSTEDFVKSVKEEVLHNNIYVYTPKGDVIELVANATPIDFAYKVHTQVGDKMTGAIVNDNMVPLSYELKNGDIIKIITNKNSNGPSYEWINIAKTTQAKNKIKNFFNRTNKEDYIKNGKELLEKELKRKKISLGDFYKSDVLDKFFKKLKVDDLDDLYLNIGNNKISAHSVVKEFREDDEEEKPNDVLKDVKVENKSFDNDILVGDVDNIKTHMANCCLPVPGDPIVGYITKTNGISIHRKNCQNIDNEDDRMVDVSWNKNTKNKYTSILMIYSKTKDDIMLDIIQSASNMDVQVNSLNLVSKSEKNVYSIEILVDNLEHLNNFMIDLEKVSSISRVERVLQ